MKKSLVLAMAMALGVTASAYAANPFSDVPAGHWAYDSINKLAAAGVIEGYGDATFGGDKLMTRYEMAQIVAKAMAKGANVDKLAAEFADELDNLGVRVANLEKKADNVKVTGEVRFKYISKDNGAGEKLVSSDSNHETDIRSRIWVNGQINDDWSYTGMIQNTQDLGDNAGNEKTEFKRAYVEGKLGGLDVTAGRYNAFFANGNIYDNLADGVEVSYGSNVKVKGFAGKAADGLAFADIGAGYGSDLDIEGGNYAGGELSAAQADVVGSWGLFANYYDQGFGTYLAHTTDANTFAGTGFKGYGVGANYTFAKNIVGTVVYYDTESKVAKDFGEKVADQRVWADLTFTF